MWALKLLGAEENLPEPQGYLPQRVLQLLG